MRHIIPLEDFLFESKRTAKENYLDRGLISENNFNLFLEVDTTPTKKFIDSMCQYFVNGSHKEDIISAFTQAIPLFTKGIIKVDIKSIKTLDELLTIVDEKSSHKTRSSIRDEAKEGATVVYEDGRYKILRIDTREASLIYGKGTKWCISANNDVGGHQAFDTYYAEGCNNIYFIISKNNNMDDPLYKVAVVVSPHGVLSAWDSKDKEIGFSETMKILGVDKSIFKYTGYVHNFETKKEVEITLNGMGYSIKDYKLGIAFKIDNPKREVRICKLLNRLVDAEKEYYSQIPQILYDYNNDLDRIN